MSGNAPGALPRGALALLFASSLVFSLLVAEGVVRVFFERFWDAEELVRHRTQHSFKFFIEPHDDPAIYYRLKPGVDADFLGSRIVTNADGVRVSPNGGPRPGSDALHIMLVGDSTSFGYRVDYEDTYAERLRMELSRARGRPVVLSNYSVPGYNASQEFEVFRRFAERESPDLLLVHHDHNDAQPTGWGKPPTYIAPYYGDNALHSALLKLLLRQAKALQNLFDVHIDDDSHEYVKGYIASGPRYEAQVSAREALLGEARARGIPAVVIIFNAFVEADPDWREGETYLRLHRPLAERLDAMGYHVIDLYPHYQRLLAERRWENLREWWVEIEPLDAHPNAGGHAFIAEVLADELRADSELWEQLMR